jgi:FkbM family methyltransferase
LYIIYTLKWNKNEKDFLYFLKMITGEGIVLDIGANIGIMTAHLAKRLPGSKIYSIEPIPKNTRALKRIIRFFKLKNVEVLEFALGNETGDIEMVMPVVDSVKMQGLSHVVHESIGGFNEGDKFRVAVRKLDDLEFLRNSNQKLKAIKIDVENFEFFVLEGGRNLIGKYQPLIYAELWDNDNRKNCFGLMKGLKYSIRVLHGGSLVDFNPGIHHTQNFFFIPNFAAN